MEMFAQLIDFILHVDAHLMAFVESKQISKYAVPDRVLFVEAIEKTSVGKLDKKVLRQKYDV